jgi:hypothetical protein
MTTINGAPWIDRRAARDTAAAARAQADAAALVAEQQAANLAADREHQREVWHEQKRANRQAEKAAARARRAAAWKARRVAAAAGLPRLVEIIACASPTAIAFRGQLAFAEGPMHLGNMAILFPITLEGVAWALAWRRHAAMEKGEPTSLLTTTMWALALTAAAMNVWHGTEDTPATEDTPKREGSLQVGIGYGIASLVGFVLIEVIAGARRAADTADKLGLARWFRYFRIAFSAWSYRVAAGSDCTWTQAWTHAWVDKGRTLPKPTPTEEPPAGEQEEDEPGVDTKPIPVVEPLDRPEPVALVQPSRMRTWRPSSRPTTRRHRTTGRVDTLRPTPRELPGDEPKTPRKPKKTIADRVAEGAGWPTINREFFGNLSESKARAAVKQYQHLRTNNPEAEEGQA